MTRDDKWRSYFLLFHGKCEKKSCWLVLCVQLQLVPCIIMCYIFCQHKLFFSRRHPFPSTDSDIVSGRKVVGNKLAGYRFLTRSIWTLLCMFWSDVSMFTSLACLSFRFCLFMSWIIIKVKKSKGKGDMKAKMPFTLLLFLIKMSTSSAHTTYKYIVCSCKTRVTTNIATCLNFVSLIINQLQNRHFKYLF